MAKVRRSAGKCLVQLGERGAAEESVHSGVAAPLARQRFGDDGGRDDDRRAPLQRLAERDAEGFVFLGER